MEFMRSTTDSNITIGRGEVPRTVLESCDLQKHILPLLRIIVLLFQQISNILMHIL